MVDEEIYFLTKHGRFQADYLENIPIYRRRHFLYLLQKEIEKANEDMNKINSQSNFKR